MVEVEYHSIEGAPGEYFHCDRMNATLSKTACAESHRVSLTPESIACGRRFHCRSCPIGQIHSGKPVSIGKAFGSKVCPRCRRGAYRLATGVCLSCYNRERELSVGVNARGTKPLGVRPLFDLSIAYLANGVPTLAEFNRVADLQEVVFRVLRSSNDETFFGRSSLAAYKSRLSALHGATS